MTLCKIAQDCAGMTAGCDGHLCRCSSDFDFANYAAARGMKCIFFFQAEDGIRDLTVTGVQTCALPIYGAAAQQPAGACCSAQPAQPKNAGAPQEPFSGEWIVTPTRPRFPLPSCSAGEIGRASCRERV